MILKARDLAWPGLFFIKKTLNIAWKKYGSHIDSYSIFFKCDLRTGATMNERKKKLRVQRAFAAIVALKRCGYRVQE